MRQTTSAFSWKNDILYQNQQAKASEPLENDAPITGQGITWVSMWKKLRETERQYKQPTNHIKHTSLQELPTVYLFLTTVCITFKNNS